MKIYYHTEKELVDRIQKSINNMLGIYSITLSIWNGFGFRRMVVVETKRYETVKFAGDFDSFTLADIDDIRYGGLADLRGYGRTAENIIRKNFPDVIFNVDLSGGEYLEDDHLSNISISDLPWLM